MTARTTLGAILALVLTLTACAPEPTAPAAPDAPYVLVLGTAQDAGLPQIGCWRACCQAARRDPARRRLVTSLMICDPASGGRWLIDATPDLPAQIERAAGHPPTRPHTDRPPEDGPRPPLVDGIFLTHAHMGHITGLAQLGREAYAADDVPTHGSAAMVDLLTRHGAWALLVELDHIEPIEIRDDEPVVLARDALGAPRLSITPLAVPHRAELSDTFGYRIDGPERSVLFVPDIDKWHLWERSLADELDAVDVGLIDGSFAVEGEIPGRSMAEIPHPFVVETLDELSSRPDLKARVRFIHLNHTNPLADPDSSVASDVRATGATVAVEGEVIAL